MVAQMVSQSVDVSGWGALWAMPAAVLVITMLWGLANCFLGYGIFRISLVITGMLIGVWGGMILVLAVRGSGAIGVDFLAACSVLAIILGVASWLLFRIFFALLVAIVVIAVMIICVLGSASAGSLVIACMVGLAAGIIAFLFTRISIILVTALDGAASAVAAVVVIILGGDQAKLALQEDGGLQWQIWLTVAIAVALATAGIYVQILLARNVKLVWAPPDNKKKRKRASSRQR